MDALKKAVTYIIVFAIGVLLCGIVGRCTATEELEAAIRDNAKATIRIAELEKTIDGAEQAISDLKNILAGERDDHVRLKAEIDRQRGIIKRLVGANIETEGGLSRAIQYNLEAEKILREILEKIED